ncbi:M1 family metallopeptidase [Streptomyces sp. NPDC050636]|uniref:M1 family metallopeptidase n=1 Tax=Streptomyces sp. NPDC050636 TaxID=3154510 RepID=UPI003420D80F
MDGYGGSAGAAGVGDGYFPLGGNGGYTVDHYDIKVTYDPATARLRGDTTVSAHTTQALSSFHLDLQGLAVSSVAVNGRSASFAHKGQELTVTPAAALAPGAAFTARVRYAGKPQPLPNQGGWTPTSDGSFVANEPNGAQTWFPCNNHPSDKATFAVAITVPKGYTAMSGGLLKATTTAKDMTTYAWVETVPATTYAITATIGKFDFSAYTTPSGIPAYNAVAPAQAAAAAPALAQLPSILDWLIGLLGAYPFASTGAIVADQPQIGYAVGTQGRPLFSSAPSTTLLVRELSHQWWGDSVTVSRWQDLWLEMGFATYTQWLYDEQHGGRTAQQAFDEKYALPADDPLWSVPTADPGVPQLFGNAVNIRGGMVLHEVRKAVGDEPFFSLLKSWAAAKRLGNVSTAEFEAYARSETGVDLNAVFVTWLHTAGKPALA